MMQETSLLNQLARSLLTGQVNASADPHRPLWHLAPAVGLLNDPNGFIQARGRYHLFYQWNPLACKHGAKFWGHWSSRDLVQWRHEPVALVPSEEYERNGCYSGSAVEQDGRIMLVYTGNVKYQDGNRTAYQCLAREQDDGQYEKLGPVLFLPAGYTGHVRDPKVWQHQGQWYMVLAAQDEAKQGKVLLYRSPDLHQWESLGEIAGSGLNGMGEFGYMWECPDLFRLDDSDVLISCPQGVAPQGERFRNLFQAGYVLGQLDYAKGQFPHGAFEELDLGFEFYAPQTTLAADGRRLMFGWMGLPDEHEASQPTIAHGWIHCMTCPRELTLRDGKLYQLPVAELSALRREPLAWQGIADEAPPLPARSAELHLKPEGPFSLALREAATLSWDGRCLSLERSNWHTGEREQRTWRGELDELRLLLDSSSIEIFINQGAAAMSARYFPGEAATMRLSGTARLGLQHWSLAASVIE